MTIQPAVPAGTARKGFCLRDADSRSGSRLASRGAPRCSEESIQRAVVQLLTLTAKPDVAWTHVPNGEARHKGVAGKLKGMGVKPGWPDIMLIRQGRCYGLELKTAKGKLSPAQIAAHEALREAGCEVATAHGFDEAHRALLSWGLIRGSAGIATAAPSLPAGSPEGSRKRPP